MPARIYIANLPWETTEGEVRNLFLDFGSVTEVKLINDRETGRFRGFGFVQMGNDKQTEAAISGLNETDFGGRTIHVQVAQERPKREGAPARRPPDNRGRGDDERRGGGGRDDYEERGNRRR